MLADGGPLAAFGRLRRGGASTDVVTLLAGYATQAYGAVVSLAFAPAILRAVGPEAYGLVGVFLIVQAWFQLIDAGMTPALTRETARFAGGVVDASSLARTVRGMELIVGLAAIPLFLFAASLSERVATTWLDTDALSVEQVATAFQLMAVILVIRWFSGVRRGVLVGFERHARLHAVTFTVATLRYPCILLWFAVVDATPYNYFAFQLFISVCEALVLWAGSRRDLPAREHTPMVASIRSLRSIAAFATTHGLLAIAWIAIIQTDKLLLTRHLSLAHFGYFTLAAAAAAGVNLIVLPLAQMLKPRLTKLYALGEEARMQATYRLATRVAMVSLAGLTATFLFFGHEVMLAWTGDPDVAMVGGPVLAYYTLGNLAMALGSFAYYIQYAHGDLRLHVWGTLIKLVAIVPTIYFAVTAYGFRGTAIAWAAFWTLHVLTWIAYTHRTFLPGQHLSWLVRDIGRPLLPALLAGATLSRTLTLPEDRAGAALALVAMAGGLTLLAATFSDLRGSSRSLADRPRVGPTAGVGRQPTGKTP